MIRLVSALLLAVVHGQREIRNAASSHRTGRITFGRVSLTGSLPAGLSVTSTLLPECNEESMLDTSALDTSQWEASAESMKISSRRSENRPASARTRLLRPEMIDKELPVETTVSMGASPSREVLEGVTKPLVDTEIWNRLTGREFDVPQVLESFSGTCVNIAMQHSNNQWVDWKPARRGTLKVQNGDLDEVTALEHGDILVYLGRFKQEGYGNQLPLVKTRSIVPLPPKEFAELLMDSSRVKTYNHMSLGRSDIHVMQKGLDTTSGPFGDGEAKIVRNLTKHPLAKQKMEFVTMMHARPLRPEDGVEGAGYLVVSRAVGGNIYGGAGEEDSLTRNEILLGVNVIQPAASGDPEESVVTAVTHVYSPSVPEMLAGKVGVKGGIDFVKDIRKLFRPLPA